MPSGGKRVNSGKKKEAVKEKVPKIAEEVNSDKIDFFAKTKEQMKQLGIYSQADDNAIKRYAHLCQVRLELQDEYANTDF